MSQEQPNWSLEEYKVKFQQLLNQHVGLLNAMSSLGLDLQMNGRNLSQQLQQIINPTPPTNRAQRRKLEREQLKNAKVKPAEASK